MDIILYFGFIIICLLVYMFGILSYFIEKEIKKQRSKSYIRKNKNINIILRMLYWNYRKDISLFWFISNLIAVIYFVIHAIVGGIALIFNLSKLYDFIFYYLDLTVLVYFSCVYLFFRIKELYF